MKGLGRHDYVEAPETGRWSWVIQVALDVSCEGGRRRRDSEAAGDVRLSARMGRKGREPRAGGNAALEADKAGGVLPVPQEETALPGDAGLGTLCCVLC